MPKVLGYPVSGSKLRTLREASMKRTQRQFGDIVERSETAVRRYEAQDVLTFPTQSMELLAKHLSLAIDVLATRLAPDEKENVEALDDAPLNVAPYTEERLAETVPLFELSVAAGTWVDVSDNQDGDGQRVTTAQLKQGLFRIRISGDSMEPRFPNQSVVEFRLLVTPEGTPDVEAMVRDHCYYVQLSNGTATFKCFEFANDEGELVLTAINPAYKKKLRASCEDVVRIGVFEWMLSKGM